MICKNCYAEIRKEEQQKCSKCGGTCCKTCLILSVDNKSNLKYKCNVCVMLEENIIKESQNA